MPSIALFSFVVYLLLVASVAFLAYHYTKNLSDFVLGGRKLNGPVAALSSGASDMSAWLLLALPGAAFTFGMNQIWLPIGLVIGAYCNWRWVGAPLRVYTEMANDSLTVPAYLDNRFEDKSHAIRISSALATLIFFAVYTASGLVAGAMLLQRSFGLDFNTALLSGTLIIMAYTFIGGFLAVSWTDFFQGIFMMCCLLILPVLIVIDLGGFGHVLQLLQAQGNGFLHPTHGMTLLAFVNLMTWGLGYFGQPHILVRFMAVKGVKDIPVAGRIVVAWMSFAMVGAVAVGILGAAYFSAGQINPESVFIEFSNVMFSPWISGMILAAIMSSIMCAI
ncbi:MAG: sodium/solute symporter, partial [Pseudomonadota bacterium]